MATPRAHWLFWSKGFARKPEILMIASLTGRSRQDIAVTLMEFYEWADEVSEDGSFRGFSVPMLMQSCVNTDEKFWSALQSVGWLVVTPAGIGIPNYHIWMGRNAKKRIAEAKRRANIQHSQPIFPGIDHELATDQPQIGHEFATQSKSKSKSKNLNPPNPLAGELALAFEEFWKAYPRRTGRGKAEESWLKVALDAQTAAQIIAAAKRQALTEDWRRENGKWIPYPSTWLNQKRWMDEGYVPPPLPILLPEIPPETAPRKDPREAAAILAQLRADKGATDEPAR